MNLLSWFVASRFARGRLGRLAVAVIAANTVLRQASELIEERADRYVNPDDHPLLAAVVEANAHARQHAMTKGDNFNSLDYITAMYRELGRNDQVRQGIGHMLDTVQHAPDRLPRLSRRAGRRSGKQTAAST